MNKLALATLCIIGLVIGAGIVWAVTNFSFTETAKIEGVGVQIEIKGQDETSWIPLQETDTIDWGIVEPDASYVYDIKITNVGTVVFTVSLSTQVDAKYESWTEVLSIDGDSVGLDTYISGTLTLTVPVGAEIAEYEWTSTIDTTEVT